MVYDVIVVGAGIGGLSAAAILSKEGKQVLVLEANYLPGGCCSSYWRKGYIFESGATTLMGFDEGQPLALLNEKLHLDLDATELDPAMTVWMNGRKIIRAKDRDTWISVAQHNFDNAHKQKKFWEFALKISDVVWRISSKNLSFPPTSSSDIFKLLSNNRITDYTYLPFAFISTHTVLQYFGLHRDKQFVRFINEQLLITAQSTCKQTPFLFAAPALCYTNYRNYNLKGGMIMLSAELIRKIGSEGGSVLMRKEVVEIRQPENKGNYIVKTAKGEVYETKSVLSNLPIWNLPLITAQKIKKYTQKKSNKIQDYWGAFTMGIAVKDSFPKDLTLHHQIILPEGESIPFCNSHSVFISMSDPDDTIRAPKGIRILAISTHAEQPEKWFKLGDSYEATKETVKAAIIKYISKFLPGFDENNILYSTESTPVSWQQWTRRYNGTVGGIPQNLKRPIYTWLGAKTQFEGLYLCGDTVYPGQGVPGVTLGGIIAAERIMKDL